MKLFTCDDHEGHWPVPTASIVIAGSEEEARSMLIRELRKKGFTEEDFTLKEVDINKKQTIILSDGEY